MNGIEAIANIGVIAAGVLLGGVIKDFIFALIMMRRHNKASNTQLEWLKRLEAQVETEDGGPELDPSFVETPKDGYR